MIKALFEDFKTSLFDVMLTIPFFAPFIIYIIMSKNDSNLTTIISIISSIFSIIFYIILFVRIPRNNRNKLTNKIDNFLSESKFIYSYNKESILENYSMRDNLQPLTLYDAKGWTNLFDKNSEIFNNIINKNKYNYNIRSEITLDVGGFIFQLQKINIEKYINPHRTGLFNERIVSSSNLLSGILFKINANYIDPLYLIEYADKNISSLCSSSVFNNYYGFDESETNVYIYVGNITMEDPSYFPYFDYSKDIKEFDNSLKLPIKYIVRKFFKDDLKDKVLNYLQ